MNRETPRNHNQATTADSESPADSHPVSLMCWNCGSAHARKRERLCDRCHAAGADPHWIPCTAHGWEHVSRRTRRGQQAFTCTTPTDPLPLTI